MEEYSGITIYDKNGLEFSQNSLQFIAENIKRILNTRKGERVNEPDFGSNVKSFLFMPQVAIDDLMAEIKNSVETQEPRVTVDSCTLTSATQDDVVNISLVVTVKDTGITSSVEVTV